MPPVISTIVMLRLFARRQRTSMSAYFTNSLTPPTGLGLLASLRDGAFPGRAARGPVAPRKMACRPASGNVVNFAVQGHQLAHRGGAAWSLPLLIGGGNGRQVARPRFALLPVAVLRSLRLGGGSRHFWLGVFCPRYSRDARRGLWAAALTSATQRKAPPSWWGNGAEVRMLAEGSEGQRRTFRAEPMRTAANWFRRLKRKTPHRGHSHAGFLRTPQLFPTGAPGLEVGGHKRPPLPAEMSAFEVSHRKRRVSARSPTH